MSGGGGQVTPSPSSNATFVEQEGGAIKPSQILGTIGGLAGGAAALAPISAPITVPLGILAGIGSSIASLFGGRLTSQEMNMIAMIKQRVDKRKEMGLE